MYTQTDHKSTRILIYTYTLLFIESTRYCTICLLSRLHNKRQNIENNVSVIKREQNLPILCIYNYTMIGIGNQ